MLISILSEIHNLMIISTKYYNTQEKCSVGDLADKWRVLILGPMVILEEGEVPGVLQITAELPLTKVHNPQMLR